MTKAGVRRLELLGPSAILAVSDACELMPKKPYADKIAWLRLHKLIRDFDGVEVVIYGDVLEALRGPHVPTVVPRPAEPDPWDTLPDAKVGTTQ